MTRHAGHGQHQHPLRSQQPCVAAEGFTKPWSMRREMLSPRYTTRWNELPLVKL